MIAAAMTLLETERLVLRELDSSDWSAICQFANDESINRYLSFDSMGTERGAKEYLASASSTADAQPRLSYKLGMLIKPLNTLAGSCWLDISQSDGNASIGYFIDKDHWGNGYATEMVQALLRFGFEELQLHRIYASCDAENPASRRILEKVGMRQEGLLKQHCLRNYGWADVCIYGILKPTTLKQLSASSR